MGLLKGDGRSRKATNGDLTAMGKKNLWTV